jgi:hypothetical protein
LRDDSGAVSVAFGIHTNSPEKSEPEVAQRGVFFDHQMMPHFHPGAPARNHRRAVFERVNRAQVAPVSDAGVIKKGGAVGFADGFEPVDQAGEQLALGAVPELGDFHAFARGVVAHVVHGDFCARGFSQTPRRADGR